MTKNRFEGGGKVLQNGGKPCQPHPGTQFHHYRCSLPGLAGFAADRCGGTDKAHHKSLGATPTGAIIHQTGVVVNNLTSELEKTRSFTL